ncbi:MAG: PTS glucose transporter subunit IIA, partial [Sphingomicrobium sp.]
MNTSGEPQALIVSSPVAGLTAPLEATPDPVFADRMMGDGLAIHPLSGEIRAPFDGEIVTLHESAHAVVLRSAEGVEVLIHVGIDTVALKGRGFAPAVTAGDPVSRGDLLISFDLDEVGLASTSLVTPIIVTNPDAFTIVRRNLGCAVQTSDEVMMLLPSDSVQHDA